MIKNTLIEIIREAKRKGKNKIEYKELYEELCRREGAVFGITSFYNYMKQILLMSKLGYIDLKLEVEKQGRKRILKIS